MRDPALGKQFSKPRKRRRWLQFLWFVIGFGGAYTMGCYYMAVGYLWPGRLVNLVPTGFARVEVPDDSNGADPAWCSPKLSKGKPSDVIFVIAHGHGASQGVFAELMEGLAMHGFDSIAPAMPGQDDSPYKTVGFGKTEAHVMCKAADWVRIKRPKAKIVYAGVSMGGAAAWLASEQDPLAAGVISEAAYANFGEALHTVFSSKAPGADIYLRPVVWFAQWMSGLQADQIRPVDAAAKWKGRPALVIEGAIDRTIPLIHAQRLSEASGASLWIIPGAAHADGFVVAPKEYLDHYVKFADEVRKLHPTN